MNLFQASVRMAVVATAVAVVHCRAEAQTIIIPPPTYVSVDFDARVVADPGCGKVLERIGYGTRYHPDTWFSQPSGVEALIGDIVYVRGSVWLVQCIQPCTLGVSCLYFVDLDFSGPLSTVFCTGSDFFLQCPCGNVSEPTAQSGCENSTGVGAALRALGVADADVPALVLRVEGAVPSGVGLVFSGQSEIGIPFNDGILCAGAPTRRVEVVPLDAFGVGETATDLLPPSGLVPGDERVYQFWYRDPVAGPCGLGSNLSNAVRIDWE